MGRGPKIFGIGFQKTGTTTLYHACQMLGYRVMPGKNVRTAYWEALAGGASLDSTASQLEPWDLFQDHPFFWPGIAPGGRPYYTWAREHYPDALFILTSRITPDAWRRSMKSHMARCGYADKAPEPGTVDYVKREMVYGKAATEALDYDHYTRVYEDYNREARSYLAQHAPGRWIELCWEKGHGWKELCGFLSVRRPWFRRFPRANQAAAKPKDKPKRIPRKMDPTGTQT